MGGRRTTPGDGMSSATIRKMGAVLGTGALLILLLCAPVSAGPGSGHQKSPNGATQGAAHSNPDGGGVDKPYAAAGQDARSQGSSDWDGNNGCGNDDDREDDNNGWCGRKPDQQPDQQAAAASVKAAEVKSAKAAKAADVEKAKAAKAMDAVASAAGVAAQVLGVQFEAAAATTTATAAAPAPAAAAAADTGRATEVLGVQVSRGEALAATGVPVLALVLAGIALVLGGAGLRRMGRARS